MRLDYFKEKFRIPSNRLKKWDYSTPGYYFVTICKKNHKCHFGEIKNRKVFLSEIGKIAKQIWQEIPKHFNNVRLDEYIVMPNHVHGIIVINRRKIKSVETCHGMSLQNNFSHPISKSLSIIVNHYKSAVKRYANKNNIIFSWQPNYYDHIIRTEKSLFAIREYIRNNPLNWETDKENPKNVDDPFQRR